MGLVLDFPYVLEYPHVGVAEFRRHPTFLDSQNLVTAGTGPDQDAALYNVLLTASQMADDKVNMPLAAHTRTENARLYPTLSGQLRYHPDHAPVLEVTGMAVGDRPGALVEVSNPQVFIERNGRVVIANNPGVATGGPAMQFSLAPAVAVGGEVMTSWTYVAGYPITQLTAGADADATAVTVRNAAGIRAGSVLRLWTPGLEEAITVASVAGSTLTLAAPLGKAHEVEDTCSALPATARQAVILFAVAQLMRPASAFEQNLFTRVSGGRGSVSPPAMSSTAGDAHRMSGGAHLIEHACHLLKPFKRVR